MAVETEYTQTLAMLLRAKMTPKAKAVRVQDEDGVAHQVRRITVLAENPERMEDKARDQLMLDFTDDGVLLRFKYVDYGEDHDYCVEDAAPEDLEELDELCHELELVDHACRALLVEVDGLCDGLRHCALTPKAKWIRTRLRARQRRLVKLLDAFLSDAHGTPPGQGVR